MNVGTISDRIDLLSKQDLLREMSITDLAAITTFTRTKSWKGERFCFTVGDEGHELIFVSEGRVRISVMSRKRRELILGYAGRMSHLGEVALFGQTARTADATAAVGNRAASAS